VNHVSAFYVKIDKKAEKYLDKLKSKIRNRIVAALFELEYNPVPANKFNTVKVSSSKHTYRIRIGDQRIIYDVHWKDKSVEILVIEKRKGRTYKKF
jgi:mRNA-degrading endonuclease RelE of RelBE toxin-antitoxin system